MTKEELCAESWRPGLEGDSDSMTLEQGDPRKGREREDTGDTEPKEDRGSKTVRFLPLPKGQKHQLQRLALNVFTVSVDM